MKLLEIFMIIKQEEVTAITGLTNLDPNFYIVYYFVNYFAWYLFFNMYKVIKTILRALTRRLF